MFKKTIKKLKFASGKTKVANDVNAFKESETQKIGKCE
jgi:hypothetical protein